MLSFSTCWNSSRHTAGNEMLREIKNKLGFDLIELGHGIRISLMPGVQKMFDAGEVRCRWKWRTRHPIAIPSRALLDTNASVPSS
jgi:hypothetical protein